MTKYLPKPAVSAAVVREGRILLVRRGCEPNKGLWSLPGGSIEPGETLREAVAREVFEETCLAVEVGEVAGAYDVISRRGDEIAYHYVIVTLFAEVVSGDLEPSSDAADARWVPLDKLADYRTTPGLLDRLASMGIST